jgi:hypothetical protein
MNEIIIRLESKNNKVKLYIKKYGLWSLWNGLDVWIKKMGLSILSIQLGEVEIATDLDDSQKQMLSRTWIQLVLNY